MNLQLNELTKRYGAKEALKGISLTVEGGRTLGFLGRNGAGKTTTLRILAGVFAPDGGSVVYNGAPLDRRATTVGYLPEERGLYSKVGILDQLTYIGQLKGMNRSHAKNAARRCLQEFELEDCAGKPLGTLSRATSRRYRSSSPCSTTRTSSFWMSPSAVSTPSTPARSSESSAVTNPRVRSSSSPATKCPTWRNSAPTSPSSAKAAFC